VTQATEEFILFLAQYGWEQVVAVLVLASVRPLALFYGFIGFYWSMGQARLVRVCMAVAVGVPVAVANVPTLALVVTEYSMFDLARTAITEMVIGLAMGLIVSLPFFAMQYAGAITDQFRGESDSGITNPSGGTISTMGMLYTLLALLAFAHADGLILLFDFFFASYAVWPLTAALPELTNASLEMVFELTTHMMLFAARLAFPLLLTLALIELGSIVGARLYKRYSFYNFSFLLKNVATIMLLPILVMYAWTLSQDSFLQVFLHFNVREFFGQ